MTLNARIIVLVHFCINTLRHIYFLKLQGGGLQPPSPSPKSATEYLFTQDKIAVYNHAIHCTKWLHKLAMSSVFYKRTLLTFYMQHEIKLDVSFNFIYSFPMIASNIPGNL